MDLQLKLEQLITDDLRRCETLYRKFSKQLPKLPRGSLVLRCGTYYRAVRENGKQYFAMLTESESDLIHNLKLKRYINKSLALLQHRIEADKSFLTESVIYDPENIRNKLPVQYSDIADLDIFLSGDINPDLWKSESYPSNPLDITIPHFTPEGLKTRSKSEEIIGTRLEEQGFAFRYEPKLILGTKSVYPDFAVLLPGRRRIVYWEHLGMIDDPEYVMKNLEKLKLYARHGIYLGINLIITYETREQPLTVIDVDDKIRLLRQMDKK